MIPDTDKAYIAGLFDGEGSVFFKRATEKKKKHNGKGYRTSQSMRINMEITMTDESVIRWVHEVLGCGTVTRKPRKGLRKDGTKYLVTGPKRKILPYGNRIRVLAGKALSQSCWKSCQSYTLTLHKLTWGTLSSVLLYRTAIHKFV